MKRTKFAVALVAAAMTVTSLGIPAFAADQSTTTVTADQEYTDNNPKIGTSNFWNVTKQSLTTITNEGGIGGKNSGDKSLKLTVNSDGATDTQYLDGFINYGSSDSAFTGKVTYEVSVYQSVAAQMQIGLRVNDKTTSQIVTFNSTGTAIFLGNSSDRFLNSTDLDTGKTFREEYAAAIPYKTLNRWVKVALTADTDTNGITVRIDGNKIGTIALSRVDTNTSNPTAISYITRLRVASPIKNLTEGFFAVDDVHVYAGDYVEKTVPAFTANDSSVTVNTGSAFEASTIALTENFEFAYYSDYITKTESDSRTAFLNADMTTTTEAVDGTIIFVENQNTHMYRYYTVSSTDTESPKTIILDDHAIEPDGTKIDENDNNVGKWSYEGYATLDTTNNTGIGGRLATDVSAKFVNAAAGEREHIRYAIQGGHETYTKAKAMNVEYSIYSAGVNVYPALKVKYVGDSEPTFVHLAKLNADGTLQIRKEGVENNTSYKTAVSGVYQPYGWNRIQAHIPNDSDTVALYVNGNKYSVSLPKAIDYVYSLRVAAALENDTDTSHFFAIDDAYIYTGSHEATATIAAAAAVDGQSTVEGSVITLEGVEGSVATSDVANYVTLPAGYTYTYYTDKTCTTVADTVTSGETTLCIADNTNNVYRYYTINIDEDEQTAEFKLTVDGVEKEALEAGQVKVTLDNAEEDGKMIVAVYNSGVLENTYINDTATDGNEITFTVADASNRTLKCFFWNDAYSTVKPIIDAKPF